MHLKSLEIQGFKSFATKSLYEFDKGITTIVGPNGSGKSNIADAIRWVLGEQGYTNLRAQKTADMIFSGSNTRPRLGMAYVSIVLDNRDGALPLDYNEVTIARRAFRSGENEYLINNNRVRLKDVVEILARGGLARQTYTLVGQGTIDRALSLRSSERRQLFEEAAGITYHRQQRADALRRLDETQQNLLRANDIVQEIEPRLKRLGKQAAKAEEYQTIRRHLDGLLKVWYGYLWQQGQQSLHHARVRQTIGRERQQEAHERLAETAAKIGQLRAQQMEIRSQLGNWHAQSSNLHSQAELVQRELAVGEERARQLAAQREEFISEIERLEITFVQQQERVDQAKAALQMIDEAAQATQRELQVLEKRLAEHQGRRKVLERQLRQAETEAQQATNRGADRQSRLTQLIERIEELQSQRAEHQQAIEILDQQKQTVETQFITRQKALAELEADLRIAKQQQASKAGEKDRLIQENQPLQQRLANIEKALASLQARQDLLAKLRSDLSGYHNGVKAVLQTKSLSGIRGTVAQLITVPAHLETAVEAAVGGRLQEVIVAEWSDADKAIQHLKKRNVGRATFLPLDTLRPPKLLQSPSSPGVLGAATDLIEFNPAIAPAVESVFNRLLVVEDLAAAKTAFEQLKGNFQIVTQAGEVVRSGGSVSGGHINRKQQGGFLTQEREWRELPAQITNAEKTLVDIQRQIAQNVTAQSVLQTEMDEVASREADLLADIEQIKKTTIKDDADLADFSRQIVWHQKTLHKLGQDIEAYQNQQKSFADEVARWAEIQAQAEKAAATSRTEIEKLSSETLYADQSAVQSKVVLNREKRRNQQTLLNNFAEQVQQTESQLDQRRNRIDGLADQRQSLLAQLQTQQDQHKQLVTLVQQYTEKIAPAEACLQKLEVEQSTLETVESQQQNTLRRIEGEANRLDLELVREQDRMKDLQRHIEDDFGLVQLHLSDDQVGQPVLPIETMVTQLPQVDELPAGVEDDLRRFKQQLRQLGNINPDAPKEFADLQTRYTFLSQQMTDLEAASGDLKSVITELDTQMETAFLETFTQVAQAFQHYFKVLFNGGEAALHLTYPDNITDTGIEIVARPPGKRPQNLELLSGGERSLTAQALIFALLKTSPTPYVIFDEVDAMLDEANVDRFRKALVALSQDIQFIVITHNRKTVEVANTIYGIFMRDDAVSEAISLKLDDFVTTDKDKTLQQLQFPVKPSHPPLAKAG